MTPTLLAMALAEPWLAGATGLLLGLLATAAGARVAFWTHRLGLRAQPPPRPTGGWVLALALGAISAAIAAAGGAMDLRGGLLGLVWGHTAMDFANSARASAALRAVADGPETLAAWRQVPAYARYRLSTATGWAVVVMLSVVALLEPTPVVFGVLLGAISHQLWQRQAVARAIVTAAEAEGGPIA